jgi:hypothetical protein
MEAGKILKYLHATEQGTLTEGEGSADTVELLIG